MSADCPGRPGHCCWLGPFGICPALRDDGPDAERRYVCTLREAKGSWVAVHESEEYAQSGIGPIVRDLVAVDCGEWPRPGETCATCGVTGG